VHNEVEANIATVRNWKASKKYMTNKRVKQKCMAAANVAVPTAAALPLGMSAGMSAFSLKQNGEPRKTKRVAVVAKLMRVPRPRRSGAGRRRRRGRQRRQGGGGRVTRTTTTRPRVRSASQRSGKTFLICEL